MTNSEVTITIDLSGAAFDEHGDELRRILSRVADLVACGQTSARLLDANGNRAGWFEVSADEFAQHQAERSQPAAKIKCGRCGSTIMRMADGSWSTGYPSHLAITCDGLHLHWPA